MPIGLLENLAAHHIITNNFLMVKSENSDSSILAA